MRIPIWFRCLLLRFEVRGERSRLAQLLGHECAAQRQYAMTNDLELRARRARVVADLAQRIACCRTRLSRLRKTLTCLSNGLPEPTYGHV